MIGLIAIGIEIAIRGIAFDSTTAVFDIGIALTMWACGSVFAAYFDNGEAALARIKVVPSAQGSQVWQGTPPTREDIEGPSELSRLKQLLFVIALWLVCVMLIEKNQDGVTAVFAWSPKARTAFLWTVGCAMLSTGVSANAIRRVAKR